METKSKHTPGPWRVDPESEEAYDIMAGERRIVAQVLTQRDDATVATVNARLIAAAPELLEALEAAEKELQELDDSDALFMARAAIAKAKGTDP